MSVLTAEAIFAAVDHLPAAVRDTPQFEHAGLSLLAGRSVVVKDETATPVRCFKARGTWTALRELGARAECGVTAATAGNFGIGLAYAARAIGVAANVFVGESANPRRVERIRELGATVVVGGADAIEVIEAARTAAAHDGSYFLMEGKDAAISVGAGTIGLELTQGSLPAIGTVYVPTGGGSLLAGVGTWFRTVSPGTRIVGVQPERAPALALSWRSKSVVETPTCDTCADGLAMRRPIPEAPQLLGSAVDDFVLVSEEEIRDAQAALTRELGAPVEPSAAASLAGLLKDDGDEPVAILVTGANV